MAVNSLCECVLIRFSCIDSLMVQTVDQIHAIAVPDWLLQMDVVDDDDDDDETWIYIAHRHKISNALNTLVLRQKECL